MKHLYNILYSLLLIAGVSSCVTEDAFTDCSDNGNKEGYGNAQVMLSLSVPNSQIPSATRAINESDIDRIYVLDFADNKLREVIDITNKYNSVTSDSKSKNLYVAIKETTASVRLALVANTNINLSELIGSTLAEVKKALTFSDLNSLNYIPMYGETKELGAINRDKKYDVNVDLVRSFAKIEVQYNSTQSTAEFQFLGIEVLNVNTQGYITGDEIYSPQTSTNLSATPSKLHEPGAALRQEIASVYIGETINSSLNKVSVLVHGIFKGVEGYYRLDMYKKNSATANEEISKLERNYKYVFSLQNVNFDGRTREDALKNDADNKLLNANLMTLTAAEGDILDITTDDQYFLGVNSSTLKLTDNGNICFAKLKVLTDNAEGWTIADYPTTGVTFTPGITGGKGDRVVNTVWIYIDRKIINGPFNFYVKTGKIRKTITVYLP